MGGSSCVLLENSSHKLPRIIDLPTLHQKNPFLLSSPLGCKASNVIPPFFLNSLDISAVCMNDLSHSFLFCLYSSYSWSSRFYLDFVHINIFCLLILEIFQNSLRNRYISFQAAKCYCPKLYIFTGS